MARTERLVASVLLQLDVLSNLDVLLGVRVGDAWLGAEHHWDTDSHDENEDGGNVVDGAHVQTTELKQLLFRITGRSGAETRRKETVDEHIDNGRHVAVNAFAVVALVLDALSVGSSISAKVGGINISGGEKFDNDLHIHPAEKTPEDQDTSSNLSEDVQILSIRSRVHSLDDDTH